MVRTPVLVRTITEASLADLIKAMFQRADALENAIKQDLWVMSAQVIPDAVIVHASKKSVCPLLGRATTLTLGGDA